MTLNAILISSVAMVRDLVGVLDREKEPIGILLTLEPPTQPMITEAAAAGLYHNDFWHRDYPRVQIITVEEMLGGKRPDIPWGRSPFAQAPASGSEHSKGGSDVCHSERSEESGAVDDAE